MPLEQVVFFSQETILNLRADIRNTSEQNSQRLQSQEERLPYFQLSLDLRQIVEPILSYQDIPYSNVLLHNTIHTTFLSYTYNQMEYVFH